MKKILLLATLCLLVLPNAFSATTHMPCYSEEPSKITIKSFSFEDSGDFQIALVNLMEKIEIDSISNTGSFSIKEPPIGPVDSTEEFTLSGQYPINQEVREEIIIKYSNKKGETHQTTINCLGSSPTYSSELGTLRLIIILGLGVLLTLFGATIVFYGRKKKKRKTKIAGFLIILAGAYFLSAFIMATFFTG